MGEIGMTKRKKDLIRLTESHPGKTKIDIPADHLGNAIDPPPMESPRKVIKRLKNHGRQKAKLRTDLPRRGGAAQTGRGSSPEHGVDLPGAGPG